jgi:hypothetical protein
MRRFLISEDAARQIDAAVKILGIFIFSWSVFQFFLVESYRDDARRQERAIDYIQEFSEGRILSDRSNLEDFWVGASSLIGLVGRRDVSRQMFESILIAELNNDRETRQSLLTVLNFFEELNFCYQSRLCSKEIVESYFCELASGYTQTYGAYIFHYRTQVGRRNLANGLFGFEEHCKSLGTRLSSIL